MWEFPNTLLWKYKMWEFPGGPVVRTLQFHCTTPGKRFSVDDLPRLFPSGIFRHSAPLFCPLPAESSLQHQSGPKIYKIIKNVGSMQSGLGTVPAGELLMVSHSLSLRSQRCQRRYKQVNGKLSQSANCSKAEHTDSLSSATEGSRAHSCKAGKEVLREGCVR